MSLHLQRIRFSVRTKNQLFAGTNSRVSLIYVIEDEHNHPGLDPGQYEEKLDHPFHDDFQRGAIDMYEVDLAPGSSGRSAGGVAVPNGVMFRDWDHVKQMEFGLVIDGSDQWIFDRYILTGYFKELRQVEGKPEEYEVLDLGWLEMAKHTGDFSMSTDAKEGEQLHAIPLNGKFQ